ncbi:hypothetical protein [Marinobacter subterrani]|uniref:Uncharacterized protein n=1 Tax=Marinobacter subterrani TaxID=1658765 RepID=A0A0J7M609_9GAMM|nr:hypothetical protein [Marinobacter subterrani]KMQ76390.1 hypothetical protein Msub_12603 [Marinobacter subterrani]
MSLGNESNDAEYERAMVLYEAAVQMVVHGQERDSAIKTAESIYTQRMEAERSHQVQVDEQGSVVSYLNDSLNPSELESEHRDAVGGKYAELCFEEGLELV